MWRNAVTAAIEMDGYIFIGQSTMVGLVLFVFGKAAVKESLRNVQTAIVKTGWGGLLGNKGSVMWRAELGTGGPSVCAVSSHFASGRENVGPRNDCYAMAVGPKCFPPLVAGAAADATPTAVVVGADGAVADGAGAGPPSLPVVGGRPAPPAAKSRFGAFTASFASKFEGMLFGDDLTAEGAARLKAEQEAAAAAAALLPTGRGVLDHDLVLWCGDFNYALHESVEPQVPPPPHQNRRRFFFAGARAKARPFRAARAQG